MFTVAIIDSGINVNYDCIRQVHMVEGHAVKEICTDTYGHGTAMFSIIFHNLVNKEDAKFISIRVCMDSEENDEWGKELLYALRYCKENKVDLINISLGFQTCNELKKQIADEITALNRQGCIIVAAIHPHLKITLPWSLEGVVRVF